MFFQGISLVLLIGNSSFVFSFYLYFFDSMNLGETVIYCGCFYVRATLCRLWESSILGARVVFGRILAISFLRVCWPLSPCWQCVWWCCDQSLHWMLGRASSLLCGCHSPVRGRVCSPVVRVEAPRSGSKLQCEVGGTGALSLGKELLCILPQ